MSSRFARILSVMGFLCVFAVGLSFLSGNIKEVSAQLRSPLFFLPGSGGVSGNAPPIASIDQATPTSGVEPLVVSFVGSGTDADDDPLTYNWDFKDGDTSTQSTVAHQFTAGNYIVEFWVNDGQVDSLKKTKLITVSASSGTQVGPIEGVKAESYADFENNTQDIVLSWTGIEGANFYTVYNMSDGTEVSIGQVSVEGTTSNMFYTVNDMPYVDLSSHYKFAVRPFGGEVAGTSCNDGVKNNDETDVDCGGACIANCANGEVCLSNLDCISTFCQGGFCEDAAVCGNGVKDGDETDVDCGGSCNGCDDGKVCVVNGDCASGSCEGGFCEAGLVIPPPAMPFM